MSPDYGSYRLSQHLPLFLFEGLPELIKMENLKYQYYHPKFRVEL